MLSNRGLRTSTLALQGARRHVTAANAKSFSTSRVVARSSCLQSPSHTLRSHLPPMKPHFAAASILLPHLAGRRFASTTPSTASIPTNQTPLPETSASSIASPETFTDGFAVADTTSILSQPETIGYLHSLGLDYGWGPTSVVEWLLEHVHVYAGTPWWASIGITAVIIRLVFLKPYMDAASNAAKMSEIQHITKPLTDEMLAASRLPNNQQHVMGLRRELSLIHKRAGVSVVKGFTPLLQIPFGYGVFVLLRGMANLPVPGLETGGLAWFHNLTVSDPYYLLPALTAGVLHMVLKRGGETGVSTMSDNTMRIMSIAFPAISFLFTAWLPAGLQWSFFISGALAAAQSTAFRSPAMRAATGMHPLTHPAELAARKRIAAAKDTGAPSVQERVIIAPQSSYRATSSSTLNYQSPRSTQNQSTKPGSTRLLSRFSKMRSNASQSMEEAKKSMQGYADRWGGKSSTPGVRSKAEWKAAEAYEKKAQAEDKVRIREAERLRRLKKKSKNGGSV